MSYKNWKLIDKIDVAVRTGEESYRGFNGYIVEHGDEEALKKAKDWATTRDWDREKREYVRTNEPKVYTFDNEGFTAKILDSAGGSSQGGRLSFWRCEIEKDGIKFTIGVNDGILADLIKNSDISNGLVKQKVMFARQSGQPGLIHKGMDSYKDAVADMKHKADMKKAKKTSKWEIGGVYQTLTQTDICIGEVFDTMEEYKEEHRPYSWYNRYDEKLRKRDVPVKMLAWMHVYNFDNEKVPDNFTKFLKSQLNSNYIYFSTGKPPARTKTKQLKVKESDLNLIDQLLEQKEDGEYGNRVKGRYKRLINE